MDFDVTSHDQFQTGTLFQDRNGPYLRSFGKEAVITRLNRRLHNYKRIQRKIRHDFFKPIDSFGVRAVKLPILDVLVVKGLKHVHGIAAVGTVFYAVLKDMAIFTGAEAEGLAGYSDSSMFQR